ncbi:hypothetical protein ACLB2K_007679 [Fragaria x ananassa]
MTILSIPLPRYGGVDKLIWHYNRNGRYSVKSGYWVAVQEQNRKAGVASTSVKGANSLILKVWKRLWGLKLPNKIKIRLWRACCGFLPCASVLQRRRICVDGRCKGCGFKDESIMHALWECALARKRMNWNGLVYWYGKFGMRGIEGCMDIHKGIFGTGALVRDEQGKCVGVLASPGMGVVDPQACEAIALVNGLHFCAQVGVSKVVIEGDAQNVFAALDDTQDFSFDGGILDEAKVDEEACSVPNLDTASARRRLVAGGGDVDDLVRVPFGSGGGEGEVG